MRTHEQQFASKPSAELLRPIEINKQGNAILNQSRSRQQAVLQQLAADEILRIIHYLDPDDEP